MKFIFPLVIAAASLLALPSYAKIEENLTKPLILFIVVGECGPEYEVAAKLSFSEKKVYFHSYNLKYKLPPEEQKMRESLIITSDIFINSVGSCA